MSDYNDYLLPEPCLRLDFGFGEQYLSIELGDGTGYLRLRGSEDRETELRERIASLNVENVDLDVENAKLREQAEFEHSQLEDMRNAAGVMLGEHEGLIVENAKLRKLVWDMRYNSTWTDEAREYIDGVMRELGIEVEE